MNDRLLALVQKWMEQDKNETTRAEIQRLVDANNEDELERRLGARIEFGTAGLRARMEAGFSRMNDLTVIQASQGLAEYILSTTTTDRGIVLGNDHRHNSQRFARLTAAAMISRGIKVYYYDTYVPTPLVPYGIKYLNTRTTDPGTGRVTAGVMITASHNPAADNGYKVYWANGCQIIPPHSDNIAAAIARNLEPTCWDEELVNLASDRVEKTLLPIREAYLNDLAAIVTGVEKEKEEVFKFVYTPMHGVGYPFMTEAVKRAGLGSESMVVVEEQKEPDPDFPTVKFPNPEEHGALDLAISTASADNVRLVLANDPDADRFTAAECLPSDKKQWRIFTGNELGILFAAHTLDTYRATAASIDKLNVLAMLASTVSSQMLAKMAEAEGFHFEETLTGFKWLGNRALELEKKGYFAPFAFEEAIGFMFSPIVHDKDGIAAATVFLTMARQLQARGMTPYQRLQQLYTKYGYFCSENSYFISRNPKVTRRVFAEIRAMGTPYPQTLGKRKIIWWRDLTEGYDSATKDNVPTLPVSKSSDMITCTLEGGVRFTVRGSGTEPKIKYYIECQAEKEEEARKRAVEVAQDLTNEWFRPRETGLELS